VSRLDSGFWGPSATLPDEPPIEGERPESMASRLHWDKDQARRRATAERFARGDQPPKQEDQSMKVGAAFPSKWLKAEDLGKKAVTLTIKSVEFEDVGDGEKPILFFRNAKKGLVLNKTNAETCQELFETDEMDDWVGHQIVLFPDKTSYQGKRVDCIRLRAPEEEPAAPAKSSKGKSKPVEDTSDDDDREPVLGGDDDEPDL
jgi:hypothetical protein